MDLTPSQDCGILHVVCVSHRPCDPMHDTVPFIEYAVNKSLPDNCSYVVTIRIVFMTCKMPDADIYSCLLIFLR